MDYRFGKCSQCGAEYQVPASFAHNVARCKQCKGVVHLGPARGAAAAAPAVPAPRAESPREAAAGAVPVPAPRPPESAPERATPAERAVPVAERAPSQPQIAPPRPPAPLPSPAPAAARRVEPAPRAASAWRSSAALWAGLGVAVVAAALYFFRESLFGGAERARGGTDRPADTAPPPEGAGGSELAPAGAPGGGAGREAAQGGPAPLAGAAPGSAGVDLSKLPDFQPTSDTSAEEWAQMNEWATRWLEVDSGPVGAAAWDLLLAQGRKAVPVLLNVFKRQDFALQAGRDIGDECLKALLRICNGKGVERAGVPPDSRDSAEAWQREVKLWTDAWRRAEQDVRVWIALADLETVDPAEAQRLRERFGRQRSVDPSDDD